MPGCSGQRHLLLGTAILLLGGSVPAQQRANVVLDNPLAQLSDSIQSIAAQVSPAIVQIEVLGYIHPDDDKSDEKDRIDTHIVTKTNVIASGVIMSADGYIITSAHTVNGAKRVRVNLDDRVRAPQWKSVPPVLTFDARVVGKCEQADLALLKIDADGLPTVSLVDSNTVRPGTLVVAVGNPEGLKNSVSMGIVSAVARSDNADRPVPYIQTDAPINPGSSGGALVDMNGRLVGITSFMVTEGGGSDGLGFALPSNLVQIIYQELKTRGHVRVGEIGVRVQNITSTLARGLGLSQDWGAVVSDVEPNSPAETAGLHVQDVLVSLDGQPVTGLPQFNASFYSKRAGDRVSLEVSRSGERLRFDVPVLENGDEESDDPINSILNESSRVAELGVSSVLTSVFSRSRRAAVLSLCRANWAARVSTSTSVGSRPRAARNTPSMRRESDMPLAERD